MSTLRDKKRVLVACYGGGHVHSLIPVARLLGEIDSVALEVIGFTTAQAAFVRAGIEAQGYSALLEEEDKRWLELAQSLEPQDTHPDINPHDTLAYHALGLKDLFQAHGDNRALEIYRQQGRKAFLPVEICKRYLNKVKPDLVITSTSPRSELALQYAASDLGIESLALSDLFLQIESEYICTSRYARHITVIADYVAEFLHTRGCEASRIHVSGNPAFDNLTLPKYQDESRLLRGELGVDESMRLILWVCPSAPVSMIGKPFVAASRMIEFLEQYCASRPGCRYLVRQHPNRPYVTQTDLPHGYICPPGVDIESCIYAADLVLLETSTVGLQAALLGKPVVTIDAGDYPPYAALGLSTDVAQLSDATIALDLAQAPDTQRLGYRNLGHSATTVVDFILQLLKGR